MKKLPNLSLYIHIPWCSRKCYYCDFNSYQIKKKIPQKKYIENLLNDLDKDLLIINNRKIKSIFIGGGTPSLFDPEIIEYLICHVKKKLQVSKTAEVTIESNPNTIELKKINQFIKIGINRFSIGIQTFNTKILKSLGREYSRSQVQDLLYNISNIQNINFNIDIMHNLPGQSYNNAIYDLKKIILINPSHISWYELTIEPNTIFFYKKPKNIPNERTNLKILKKGKYMLEKAGYSQYEISSFAKPGFQCIHNKNYWDFNDYIGIGCGAHGKITQINGDIIRTIKNKNIDMFMKGLYLKKKYKIKERDLPIEYFINKFRLLNPIKKICFSSKTNIPYVNIENKIKIAVNQGYLLETQFYWTITKKGINFMNNLLEIFLN
ncbi:radical SAM family heme chaperone HemW [Buchnera aphidicola]|uniref:Heme chaperone HemW n=1 Tax=Buchnera aphidicola (Anoecia oenotherae) TaxID=1241833 RepID=A0A4D6XRR0_9GAMM|nr:radical SAM family heme chaperone HemW [Buchnera aphidicola]QCI19546.1 radical SAM family heme chaperone HemW [Buchnera aphidicola (Anoecia oenotherae)]